MSTEPTFAWLDDRLVPRDAARVRADDPGLTLGDGLFETMRVVAGEVVARAAHLARFERSRRALALPPPPTDPALAIDQLLAANPLPTDVERVVRLTLTARPTLIVQLRLLGERDLVRRRGLELFTLPARRGESFLARHKSLAYGANTALRRLHPEGHRPTFEGLWLDPEGHVLEGTTTNLFALIDDVVFTPPLSAPILPGVSRATLLARLAALGLPHREAVFAHDDLRRAHGLVATNAVLPLAPVLALDGAPLPERLWQLLTAPG